MLRLLTIAVVFVLHLLLFGCSKSDDGTPEPPNPPNPASFTISNLTYSPSEVPVKTYEPTFTITGSLNFANAGDGIAK
jgi:hypothetical protein